MVSYATLYCFFLIKAQQYSPLIETYCWHYGSDKVNFGSWRKKGKLVVAHPNIWREATRFWRDVSSLSKKNINPIMKLDWPVPRKVSWQHKMLMKSKREKSQDSTSSWIDCVGLNLPEQFSTQHEHSEESEARGSCERTEWKAWQWPPESQRSWTRNWCRCAFPSTNYGITSSTYWVS